MPFDPRQKPGRVRLRPGQKWRSADGSETAIVTSVEQRVVWGQPDGMTVTFVWWTGGRTTLVSESLERFRERFPIEADEPLAVAITPPGSVTGEQIDGRTDSRRASPPVSTERWEMDDKPTGPNYKYLDWVGELRHFNARTESDVNKLLKQDPKWKLLGVFPYTAQRSDGTGWAEEYHYVLGRERE